MIILRQRNYSSSTIEQYMDYYIHKPDPVEYENGGVILPRKWSPNGKERSKNRRLGTQIIPRTPKENKNTTILERIKKFLKRKEEQREFARKDYEGLNKVQQIELKERRGEIAKKLNRSRKFQNEILLKDLKRNDEEYQKNIEDHKNFRKKLRETLGLNPKNSEEEKENLERFIRDTAEPLRKSGRKSAFRSRDRWNQINLDDARRYADEAREDILNQSSRIKYRNYKKALWNGKVGLGKGANRALMIGIPVATAAGSALAIHKHRKKKKESEENKKEDKK